MSLIDLPICNTNFVSLIEIDFPYYYSYNGSVSQHRKLSTDD